jgi:hypothetical protein
LSTPISLRQLAHALGGDVSGNQVVAPAPGHSRRDRSLAVKPSATARDGFIVCAFAPGDDWRECRDHVAERLGIRSGGAVVSERDRPVMSERTRIERASALWFEGRDPRGTVVETYLNSRAMDLPDHVALAALRFHPRCPWKDESSGLTIRVPAMLAAMRSLTTRQVTAVHRTRLTEDGRKVDRRMLGIARGAAIMLEPLDGSELVIGEGVETSLSGAELGMRPVWALASAGAIAAFPVLQGVDKLTLLAERDPASETAVTACYDRWHKAGIRVVVALPKIGKDMNDALRAAHAS